MNPAVRPAAWILAQDTTPGPRHPRKRWKPSAKVLVSGRVNYWTGEEGRLFEREFARPWAMRTRVALMNGSVALEAALRGLRSRPGDEVVVTPRIVRGLGQFGRHARARPSLPTSIRESQNITARDIEAVLTPRTKAIIAVHLAGWPCDMDQIMELARDHGLKVIEDCAQAHGARLPRPTGRSLGDCAAWSFCQDKIMTTGGEGGMLTTNDPEIWERAWSLKDHGRSYDAVFNREHPPGFRWYIESFGTNWRMTEMQAAIGRVQLGKLEDWTALRRRERLYPDRALLADSGSSGHRAAPTYPPCVLQVLRVCAAGEAEARLDPRPDHGRDRATGSAGVRRSVSGDLPGEGVCRRRSRATFPPARCPRIGGNVPHVRGASDASARAYAPDRGRCGRSDGGGNRGPSRAARRFPPCSQAVSRYRDALIRMKRCGHGVRRGYP